MPQFAPAFRPECPSCRPGRRSRRRRLVSTLLVLLALAPLAGPPAAAQLTTLGVQLLDECDPPGDCATGDGFGIALATGDFDGDGFADLAVGAAGETVGGDQNAGSIHVYYGSAAGLTTNGEQVFDTSDPDIPGAAEAGDLFGRHLAAGDFNLDGFDDLAISVDGEDLGSVEDAGTVDVLFGSANGLVTDGALSISQDNLPAESGESSEEPDSFGSSLAASTDGRLAIGVPGESYILPNEIQAGLVNVLFSDPGDPFNFATEREQNDFLDVCGAFDGNELNDFWGQALAWGNFSGGSPSLVVAGAGEDLSGNENAGRVTIMFGSTRRCLDQDSSGVFDAVEVGDNFGRSLATGDFDGDGFDDLAVGAPGEDFSATGDGKAGLVHVFFGASSGLSTAGDVAFAQDNFPLGQEAGDNDDFFGMDLTTGDFDGDGFDDLAIGVPLEDVGAAEDAGTFHVRYGGPSGFVGANDQTFHSNFPSGMPESPNSFDHLSDGLAAGDFDGNGTDDLAVGAPGEALGAVEDAGAVTVLYGFDRALDAFGEVHLNSAVTVPELTGNRPFFVTRTGGAVLAASVDHSRIGGTATPDVDFTYDGGTESWDVGDIGFETSFVHILGDTLDENNETIRIELSNPSTGLAVGTPSILTITIEDDDEGGSLQFQTPNISISEAAAQRLVVVTRTGGAASNVTILFDTNDGTATAGEDYTAATGILTFDANEAEETFAVPIRNDLTDEPNETIELRLFSPQGGGVLGSPTTATLTIVDDDPAGQLFLDGFESGDTDAWSSAVP